MTLYRTPGLRGLELWRGITRSGATLFQLREEKEKYFRGLREFLVRLQAGQAESADWDESQALRQAVGFSHAIFCGGEALHPYLLPILRSPAPPFTIEINCSGPFAGRPGALEVFRRMEWRRGVALDLGQIQLKVMTAEHACVLPRDPELLPFGAHAIDDATGRERLRALLRQGLGRVGPPDGVVLALPVALSADGIAQSATYPGLFGPVQTIFADFFECPWVVINDAVLAGLGFRPRPGEKTLVVTLGFGIGGDSVAGVVLFLSPHLDDAVLSCPAYMQRIVHEGCEVRIATVFTESNPAAAALYRTRRAEDRKAASALGAAVTHMRFLDAPYRSTRYRSFSGIVFRRAREYPATRDLLVLAIERLVARFRPSRVVCPMAVGNHVDHRLVRDAALLAMPPEELRFYEDRPYAFLREKVDHVLGKSLARRPQAFWARYFAAAYVCHYRGRTSTSHIVSSWASVPPFPIGYRLKPVSKVTLKAAQLVRAMAAVGAYRSQMADLFENEAERELLYRTTPETIYRVER